MKGKMIHKYETLYEWPRRRLVYKVTVILAFFDFYLYFSFYILERILEFLDLKCPRTIVLEDLSTEAAFTMICL